MKYIRTKNGIYDTEGSKRVNNVKACFIGNAVIYDDEVIKQSDTIEELCDCFIIEYTNTEPTMFHNFYHLQRHHDLYGQDYHNVAGRYGCIWVAGKGLIYVAKLNEKGELELL